MGLRYMKRIKDDDYYFEKILGDIDYILSILDGVGFDVFSKYQMP